MSTKTIIKYSLLCLYVGLVLAPGIIFFGNRSSLDSAIWSPALLFPLLGLYAFTLTGLQVIIGSNLRRLQPFLPGLIRFHRFQGMFALLFALLHPLIIVLAYGPSATLTYQFVSPEFRSYVTLGVLALGLMLVTVTTAVMAWRLQKFTKVWRLIHLANYAVFILAWIHSWFIGSDIQTSPLKYVWLFYLAAWTASLGLRLAKSYKKSASV